MPLMPLLKLTVLSLRYSSWSMRPWLILNHAGAEFETDTVSLPHMLDPSTNPTTSMTKRRELGSVHGLFPILTVNGGEQNDGGGITAPTTPTGIHESLAICEYVAELFPQAHLWPDDPLDRARARAISCEMVSGFPHLRDELSCHLFGRVSKAAFKPAPKTQDDIDRIFEIWSECLARSGGPFLFGDHFGIADAMYFPVLSRFRTYSVDIPEELEAYADAVESVPAVLKLKEMSRLEPAIPIYDEYIRKVGGDPEAGFHS